MTELYVPRGSHMNPHAEKDMSYTVQAVGEIVRDVYPDMHIARLPSGRAGLMHVPMDGKPPYIVRELDDSDINASLLVWIMDRDTSRINVQETIEKHNQMQKAVELKEQQLRVEEGHEFGEAVLKSKKHYYRHNGQVFS